MKPASILLIPSDPALLDDGPCGARPPMAARWWLDGVGSTHGWVDATDPRYDWPPGTPRALVLMWLGEVQRKEVLALSDRLHRMMTPDESIASAQWLATVAAKCDHGTVVLLDSDGREIDP